MPRKSKEQIEFEKQEQRRKKKIFWTIMCIVIVTMIFFALSRMGILGNIFNNVLTYIAGTFYIVPLLTMFAYAIYVVFFEDKHRRSITLILGLLTLNLAIIMLGSFISNSINDWAAFINYSDRFLDLFKDEIAFDYVNGGLIGEALYVLCSKLVDRTGVIIIMLASLLISLILIIPFETYRNAFNSMRENARQVKQEKQLRRQEEKLQKQKAEAERKQKQAEEIARLAEIETAKTQMQDIEADKRLEVEAVEAVKKVDTYSTDSPFLINLTDSEIGSGRPDGTYVSGDNREIITDEPIRGQRILKVKRNHLTYKLPKPLEQFLETSKSSSSNINKTSAAVKGKKVIEILRNFGIEASLLNTYIGPSVTKFEIKPDSNVKINKINNISDNIKMELAARDIRIEAPIPGRSAVGIEIPNVEPIPVMMLDLMKAIPDDKRQTALLFCLGKDLMGKAIFCDMVKMPHLLIAGATGSGKSVCINSIITSILLRSNPDDVKLILVDPKKVEFTLYKDIPHLLWPIIDDATMASNMLKKVVVMMEDRYDLFAQLGVRNIQAYNKAVDENNASGKKPMDRLPYFLVIIDELADLMAIAGKDVEQSIQRITQLARASGIHLIVATQRPSTDVITGLIKSNIPSRISFAVASSIDSRTILDATGAERLLGNGDMLYYPQGENAPMRLQGVFVNDKEISRVTRFVKGQAQPQYEDSYYEFLTNMNGSTVARAGSVNADSMDSLYDDVVEFVRLQQKASTSLLQRRFGIGYNRAARLIDTLEDRGIIGPANGSKPREVYLKKEADEE